jgi:hypothetical protein
MKYDWKGKKSSDAIWSKEQMESLLNLYDNVFIVRIQIISPVFSFLVDNAESKQIQFYTLKALLHVIQKVALSKYRDTCFTVQQGL